MRNNFLTLSPQMHQIGGTSGSPQVGTHRLLIFPSVSPLPCPIFSGGDSMQRYSQSPTLSLSRYLPL